MLARCDTHLSLITRFSADPPPGSLAWLLFGFMLILSYRLKLFYNSARSAMDDIYCAIAMPVWAIYPRFATSQLGVFLYVSFQYSLAPCGRGQGEGGGGPC
jgi:hypothetical protein